MAPPEEGDEGGADPFIVLKPPSGSPGRVDDLRATPGAFLCVKLMLADRPRARLRGGHGSSFGRGTTRISTTRACVSRAKAMLSAIFSACFWVGYDAGQRRHSSAAVPSPRSIILRASASQTDRAHVSEGVMASPPRGDSG